MELDEQIAPFMREAFELYASGNYTQDQIRFSLNKKLTLGERRITKGVIERCLSNPFYYGVIKVKDKIMEGKHPALISKELWDNCQRIRGIRASKTKRNAMKAQVIKPLMGMFRCGVCFSQVTGETKIKPSGKRYTYYRCANHKCQEKRKTTNEKVLMEQVIESFKPFSYLTPKSTACFLKNLEKSLPEVSSQSDKKVKELLEEQKKLKGKMNYLEDFHKKGFLDKSECEHLLSMKKEALRSNEKKLNDFLYSKDSYFAQGKKVIELLGKSYNFMKLSENSLAKARLAKIVLSNPTLKDRSLQFSYKNPFDNLTKILTTPEWWREKDLNLRRHKPADLQSAPIGRSGTPPQKKLGAGGGIRTPGQRITNASLWPLSYTGKHQEIYP